MSLNILVVDDNPGDRTLVRRYFSRAGEDVRVQEVESGQEALVYLKGSEPIDCVFLDYGLPDRDGISVLKEVYDKESDIGPFPIVMLTGQGHESVVIDAIRYGAQDYLVKSNMTPDTLHIAMTKARELFELKKRGNEDKAILVHSQKMKAVGQLTGGIAHDFNNLLTIIFGNARLLETMLESGQADQDACLEKVHIVQKATRRGAELVKRLMLFSRQTILEPQVIEVNDLISDLNVMLQRTLGDLIEVETQLGEDIHPIYIDPAQLEHVLINMAVNARDAMPNGGIVTLKTSNLVVDKVKGSVLDIRPGDYVCLGISDTGTGIPEDIQDKIFNPFFTTKDSNKGTGLGLSMVCSFVKQSGGAISFVTAAGEGTTFNIMLPVTVEEPSYHDLHSSVGKVERPIKGGSETVLVVEDEDDIRFLARIVLEDLGYTVLDAETGKAAVDLVKKSAQPIDLLFTDIAMPGDMNGVQAAARIQALRPDIKLLFATGYLAESLPDIELAERYPLIHKPYQPEELAALIRDVLNDDREA
ncbi:MAG: response regulator [Rhodospirillales bacterium]|nr:response regulator [Rhodospirillales bacterium]